MCNVGKRVCKRRNAALAAPVDLRLLNVFRLKLGIEVELGEFCFCIGSKLQRSKPCYVAGVLRICSRFFIDFDYTVMCKVDKTYILL